MRIISKKINFSSQEHKAMTKDDLIQRIESFRPFLLVLAYEKLSKVLRVRVSESDIVQETLLAAHESWQSFEGDSESELLSWLLGIFHNQLLMHARKNHDAGKRSLAREERLDEKAVTDQAMTPSKAAELKDAQAALVSALMRLPEDDRLVVQARALEHRGFAEIAVARGKTEAAIRKCWLRALEKLESMLNSNDGA